MNVIVQANYECEPVVVNEDYAKNLEMIAQDARLGKSKVDVVLVSSERGSDAELLIQALNYSVVDKCRLSDGHEIDFNTKSRSKLEIVLEVLVYANRVIKDKRLIGSALGYLEGKVEQEWKKTLFESDLEIFKELPSGEREKINHRIFAREKRIRSFHSTRFKRNIVESYAGMANTILQSKNKLHVCNGPMAAGKTQLLQEIFEIAKKEGSFPILITGKRTIADSFCKETMEDHYRREGFDSKRLGLVGVINSIIRHDFAEDRKRSKIVLIDEVEDMFDHISSGTLGELYEDRIYALDRLAELVGAADKVILADAMITDETLKWFHKSVKAWSTIHTAQPASEVKLNMRIVTEAELLGLVKEDVAAGKKAAVFCDYREEKVHEIIRGFEQVDDCRVREISRKTLDKGKWSLETLDENLLASDVAVITPIINAGVSITLKDYDTVYVMAGGTLAPTSLLQSLRRFRCAHRAVVAFRKNVGKRPILCKERYVLNQLADDVEDPLAETKKLLEQESGRFLADYARNRSYQFRGFKQVFLIAAEQVGFCVWRKGITGKVRKSGTKTKKAGEAQRLVDQKRVAFDTAFKRFAGLLSIEDTGTGGTRSFEQEVAHRTDVAMQVLEEPKITEDLYQLIFTHDLDRIVFSRMRLKRGSVASPHRIGDRDKLASLYAKAFLEVAGVDFSDISKSMITATKAGAATKLFLNSVQLETGGETRFFILFHRIFPNVNVSQRYKTKVVAECLHVLGLQLYEFGKRNGVRIYCIKDRIEILRNEVECNLAKIADEYETLPVTREIPLRELISQLNNVGVADVWGRPDGEGPKNK